jgi:hypothetical protein
MSRFLKPLLCLAVSALACLLVVGAGTAPAASTADGHSKLSKHERELVAAAKAKGTATITVMIAAKDGATKTVVAGIQGLGGSVGYTNEALGYVRARVPTGKVEDAANLDGVLALDVDEIVPLPDPRPEGISPIIAQPPPDASTPRQNPYMPTQDTGAAQFVDAHPTWDGRGVTIGLVDTGLSLDHPSLLTTSTGQPKVIDWVTGTDPVSDGDPTWLNMSNQVSVTGGSFTASSITYTGVPADGTYRFAVFNEASLGAGSEYGINCGAGVTGADLNRNGVCGERFAVLWRESDNKVFVDTDADHSFAGESGMTNYKVNRDKGWFGTDNSATAIHERVPFVVQINGQLKYVNIGIVAGFHGSHVSGIMAGNSLFGGQMSGAAPGAKIVSSRACLFVAGCTGHALFEGMIYVAQQANVDVINMSIGGLPALNDGNNARCDLYERLIQQSNVQMFISVGNSGPGVNTAGDPGICRNVMTPGAYITSDTYEKDYGTPMPFTDNIHNFSSRGPNEDGGFSPSFVAPGAAVSTTPLWQAGVGLPYALPPGYQLANGTSMAAPQSTGVAALLISAAKATSVQKQPDQIRQALMSTARYLTEGDRFQAYDQGAGLIDANAAWNMLKTNIKTADISSSVPVNTLLSGFLATPGVGTGIYDREGVTLGTSYTRTYTFTRNDGGGGNTTYNLSWVGNDGTFSLPGGTSISLGKGTPANLTVNVNPSVGGAHSAILRLDDPSTTGIDYQTMNTVIVPYAFTAPDYSQAITSDIARGQTKHYFFRVPTNTPAFKVDLSSPNNFGAGGGAIRFIRWHPWGLGIDSNAVSNCYAGQPGGTCSTGSATSRTVSNPQAGVWEVTVDARRNSDGSPTPAGFTLTATLLGATVSPNPDVIASATIGVPIARSYTLTNVFGSFTGRAVGTALGSAFRATPTIANLAQQTYTVAVPAGATSLRATIGSPSDPGADLDLYVFRPNGTLGGQSADGDSEESVTVANPVAGTWTVLVDGFSVPSGSTTYHYIDVFFKTPAFGSISITDANALRPAGSSWTVPGSVTADVAPAAGRVLYGNVEVRTDTNVLVGSGDVVVQNVSP